MFRDRRDAGQQLARRLMDYAERDDVVVLGIPRGGVPVAFEVAQALHAPLDILIVRKVGAPGQRELAIGAVASGGIHILNHELISDLGITEHHLSEMIAGEEVELRRREQLYRGVRPGISVQGKIVVLVDDGIATGSSMRAAVNALRSLHPGKIVVATPVAPSRASDLIERVADQFVCVLKPEWFFAIGEFYERFPQVEDAEVQTMLTRAAEPVGPSDQTDKRGAA